MNLRLIVMDVTGSASRYYGWEVNEVPQARDSSIHRSLLENKGVAGSMNQFRILQLFRDGLSRERNQTMFLSLLP